MYVLGSGGPVHPGRAPAADRRREPVRRPAAIQSGRPETAHPSDAATVDDAGETAVLAVSPSAGRHGA
jgi:hypothetical protein